MLAACIPASTPGQSNQSPPARKEDPSATDPETISLLPDLTLDFFWEITYTSECPWGGPGFLILRGRNIGEGDAEAFGVRVWSETQVVDSLPSGEFLQIRFEFESGPVGSIMALIDPDGQVDESDESNNEFQIIFTPPVRCTPTGG